MNHLAPVITSNAPALVAASGACASYRFLEFFTAQIRNPHTCRAYARAATEFFDWLEACCRRRESALIRRLAKPSPKKSAEEKMRRCHATDLCGRF